ncbi:M1 family aminopeptidase [uncultured Hyphomonas sp.]|uniref:M1 family metallopeptidase n=1 Tax=uncultured Hyphomonas sp. TaxID=225298 RepID=UPI002AAAF45B|nr:M1 family aminopeptidase [uncultured Hyphomonas sp.]
MRILAASLLLFLTACAQASSFGPQVRAVPMDELKAAAPAGQLSGVAQPVAYRVEMTVDPRETTFSGHVQIDVNLMTSATGIWMHGADLDVSSVQVSAGGETRPANWTEVHPTGVVWVGFPNRVHAGGITLAIDYTAAFDANLAGLFRVDEKGEAYALAKSESIQARRFLPSFDEPGFKAPFDITLTVPDDMLAIGNTPVASRVPARPGFDRVTFLRTRPLSTYLLSVAVGNFEKVSAGTIPVNAWRDWPVPLTGYARADKGDELEAILSITPAMIEFFEEALEQPYPYEKLDIIAAPQWPSGATELAAAITYRESRILANEKSGAMFLRSMKGVHAHELSHMWFGDLVTPPWWDDLWLKEGIASWAEPAVLGTLEPNGGHDIQAVVDAIAAMQLDSLSSARAVAQPITENADIRNAYDAITYNKGQAVLSMVDTWFGPDQFRPALGKYIAEYADKAADSAQFFEAIGRSTGNPDIGRSMKTFITQNGVPLLETELQCTSSGAKVVLQQSRYRPLGSDADPDRHWVIPVCVSWREGEETGRSCTLMKARRQVLPLEGARCPDAYHPNANGTGYYRFNMAAEGWTRLIAAFPGLSATEALTAIDSGEADFIAGKMDAAMLRKLLAAGAQHDDAAVASAVLNIYSELMDRLEGAEAAGLRADAEAASDRLRARMEAGDSDPELEASLVEFDATVLKQETARTQLAEEMDKWLSDPDADVNLSSDLYASGLLVLLDEGGLAAYDRVLTAYDEIDDPAFGQSVALALGSVTDPEQAARTRGLIASAELGPRETYTMALLQMQAPETREAMWAFLEANFPAFLKAIPTQWQRRTPGLAAYFCDAEGLGALNALFEEYGDLAEGHERALSQAQEKINLCMAQKAATQADLEAAFAAP